VNNNRLTQGTTNQGSIWGNY